MPFIYPRNLRPGVNLLVHLTNTFSKRPVPLGKVLEKRTEHNDPGPDTEILVIQKESGELVEVSYSLTTGKAGALSSGFAERRIG
ncbi:MAG: hypothetical protein UR39_C0002G0034 [Candidatus Woesebacteria bacterium GW2011_GWA1_33_30]|uniref:Uncharacterized protein n=1 Tax=Candidatus Woesebacteria bacterium GW2011_GWA2_33_28 TaxID=1618561 RepID=A0A0G0A9D1_9BACT|nr:MAG: hypothetical protein UR38_C0002G0034 [Candidatus Woesebacteria bacterium GW2011_GWA2_33_28]KKP48744.1 MAG: hypothetical protein UR39_C0002G0034 [Candidatus Woesebacteria bacterium GW2011_GWA1_33_30]KKP50017.1 MAG: hypothetical protein UR40_C0002G0034 [Microgenomates group bacterium GW2011_GWC1_33_32]KKP51788.1 MAG: hypothetical protein UR44_C0006G0034 [Candidatus Woesebacteria bacterium GW2011_GWB1_33_38]KKP58598.1 MAG: hypothetical protein UR48_C0003G0025 [Microgenomates group bacteriu